MSSSPGTPNHDQNTPTRRKYKKSVGKSISLMCLCDQGSLGSYQKSLMELWQV